ncbi:LysR substrate-binding domain-containing protein [Rhizobium sp. GR12]|uniref:LysR substrate-binding domain-containing protein n=1 Tax=Rhizobium sp. GR12 TaxID=3053925 RepID=UPI002FBEC16A
MDLRQIRYFVVLAEQLHFGRAAELLHMAQPPLSQQIKSLEAELRVTLIDRSSRPIALTTAGQILLKEGRQLLAQFDRVETATRQAGDGKGGRLAIGLTETAALDFASPLLRAFACAHPQVLVSLHEMNSPSQLIALENGSIHIAFVRPPVLDERFNIRLVHTEPFLIAIPSDHALAGRGAIRLREVQDLPLVIFEREEASGFRDLILHLCRAAGYTPAFFQDASQMSTMLCSVGAGLGVALVPRSASRMAIAGVTFLAILDECPNAELYAAWPKANVSPHVPNLLMQLDAL